jgi:hypothetical protein
MMLPVRAAPAERSTALRVAAAEFSAMLCIVILGCL